MKALKFYMKWYPSTYMPASSNFKVSKLNSANQAHLAYASKTCKKLARKIFHTMALYGPKLEVEQVILGNFVDIGTDLFVMSAALSYAESLLTSNPADQTPQELVDLFCCEAKRRIEMNFKIARKNHNKKYNKVAKLLMEGQLQWLARMPSPTSRRSTVTSRRTTTSILKRNRRKEFDRSETCPFAPRKGTPPFRGLP